MPELTEETLTNEEMMLRLQGGLKGRFARGFCALQGTVDALQRYLDRHAVPTVLDDAAPLFTLILQQIRELERLAGNAADLAVGAALRHHQELESIDMAAYLSFFCATANKELEKINCKARMELQLPEAAQLFVPATQALLDTVFANLLSNSLRARVDTAVTVTVDGNGVLRYRDTGPGLNGDARALLCGQAATPQFLRSGGTGLLLVLACAQELGWELTAPADQSGGCVLEMKMAVKTDSEDAPAQLCAWTAGQAANIRLQACLQRELAVALGR